jgi:hypothetical protein
MHSPDVLSVASTQKMPHFTAEATHSGRSHTVDLQYQAGNFITPKSTVMEKSKKMKRIGIWWAAFLVA